MTERLILLPGWGLGSLPLDVLAEALRGLDPALRVEIEPLPELRRGEPRDWLLELDERLPPHTWLGGWSLGGMLASELAALRGERCRGLLTLASNPCFVAGADWPYGMDEATFDAFVAGCRDHPAATLKRFSLLCTQAPFLALPTPTRWMRMTSPPAMLALRSRVKAAVNPVSRRACSASSSNWPQGQQKYCSGALLMAAMFSTPLSGMPSPSRKDTCRRAGAGLSG